MWNRPNSDKEAASDDTDLPLVSSLIRMDAVRVYTEGVRLMYSTATLSVTTKEITNQYHLDRHSCTRSRMLIKSSAGFTLFAIVVNEQLVNQ